ncbi:MAG: hypothetical protein RLW61_10430 [Gammaproteobacteria bacterium]
MKARERNMHPVQMLAAILTLLMASLAHADTLVAGAVIEPFTIADQHGRSAAVDDDVRVIMFSRDMTANKLAKKAFLDKPQSFLDDAHAMYLIDVSGMPGFVTRMFAIPKMQKYGYRIFLDREGSLTAALPAREDEVTILTMNGLEVTSVEYVKDAAALVQAVAAARP